MSSPYVYERQSEYWISRQVEEFFLDVGFEIITFPLTALREASLPADFLYFARAHTKLFGFQYKALYHDGRDYWPIDKQQHSTMPRFPWVYYCLSELRNPRDHRAALHLIRIKRGRFKYQLKLYVTGTDSIRGYIRWAAFYQGLENCDQGKRIGSHAEMLNAFRAEDDINLFRNEDGTNLPYELEQLATDTFVLDFSSRRAVHFSPYLRQSADQQAE